MTVPRLTAAELDDLDRLEREATATPWEYRADEDAVCNFSLRPPRGFGVFHYFLSDVELAVAARNALPSLLAIARRAAKLERALSSRIYHYETCEWERDKSPTRCTCGAVDRALGDEK